MRYIVKDSEITKNTLVSLYPPISAEDYRIIIHMMYGDSNKSFIAKELSISRPTHDSRLQNGITNPKHICNIRKLVEKHVTKLRKRARILDRWTTSDSITAPIPRLTYDRRSQS